LDYSLIFLLTFCIFVQILFSVVLIILIFTPSIPIPQNETLSLTVTTDLEDLFGNKLENEFSQDFTYTGSDLIVYDRVPPEVEVVKLKSGEFIVEFDEEIDSSSITDSIELTSAQGNFTGSITQEDSKTLKFVPENSLSDSVEYTINVKTTLTDLSGKNLSSLFTENFINTGKDILIYEKPNPNEHKESIISNNVLFQGRNYESETGLYYFRARYFHPGLNRFLQTDPMGYEDSMNLYQAFNQNPINFVDPMGEWVQALIPITKYVILPALAALYAIDAIDKTKKYFDKHPIYLFSTNDTDTTSVPVPITEIPGLRDLPPLTKLEDIWPHSIIDFPMEELPLQPPIIGTSLDNGPIVPPNEEIKITENIFPYIFTEGKDSKPIPWRNKKTRKIQWRDAKGKFAPPPIALPPGITIPVTPKSKLDATTADDSSLLADMIKIKIGKDAYKKMKDSTIVESGLEATFEVLKQLIDKYKDKKDKKKD